ncbi:MAG: isocitrate/isopropylmalate family dehydrogenase, partial [Casimicrobiaceae bacterium]
MLVLPGDGIGPEITAATLDVLRAVDTRLALGFEFESMDIGFAALDKEGTTLPDAVLERARECDAILLGPISHLDYPARDAGGVNVSAAFRVKLDLYANVRPARTREGLARSRDPFDLVIMRECTEGFYPDRNMFRGVGEFMPTPDVALSVRKITAFACERIARRAFELARTRRKRVTAVHKANNFILTDGLFLERVRAVAAEFPDVVLDELIVDACAAWLVRDPGRFDVICTTNFYADILSDLASELSGGL